jgi:hypothetical protein
MWYMTCILQTPSFDFLKIIIIIIIIQIIKILIIPVSPASSYFSVLGQNILLDNLISDIFD